GIWGVFDKLALKHGPPVLVLIAINSLAPLMPLFLLFFIYRLDAIASLSAEVFGWTFLAGLSYFVSMLLYLWVLNKTEASLILGPVLLPSLSGRTAGAYAYRGLYPCRSGNRGHGAFFQKVGKSRCRQ
ncbi:MAG TPA: hypothetical protein PKC98_25165, partial [Candidatus Melainabacteria bacterium]|nr:hypothetical protein [Candidatus Melainabacteria bacterium]